ncbi:hypothetical protein PC113_g3721 [Phytophthora cactorum]|uniref:Uncharacterized protein n=1 Tax=Phytophthora cactorum TaxID=29920 RepID=A0A8T0ZTN3_9STRA|nr:hypothetical protein PC111_g2623 [Phytophthora cactorum]KAG2865441.1 hypothetical protein PC113_g3721 [Phytophthora cactorum]KAG4059823.1 hypothetical protein PC123_g5244 [Phytophthora cactorum]
MQIRQLCFLISAHTKSLNPSKIAAKDNETKRCGFSTKTWPEIKQIQRETGLQIYTNGKGWWMGGLSVQFLQLQKLSTAENTSSAVDDDQEFDRIVEEAVV